MMLMTPTILWYISCTSCIQLPGYIFIRLALIPVRRSWLKWYFDNRSSLINFARIGVAPP